MNKEVGPGDWLHDFKKIRRTSFHCSVEAKKDGLGLGKSMQISIFVPS
jgi:hypothetical protein